MCFVPVPGQGDTYRHVHKKFIRTIQVNSDKLDKIAQLLGIPKKQAAVWRPGKLLIVNDVQRSKSKKRL